MLNKTAPEKRSAQKLIRALLFGSLFVANVGCSTAPVKDGLTDSASTSFLRTELYFAIGLLGETETATVARGGLGQTNWTQFVDDEVTPLFPDGLTVFNASGQWLSERFETPPKLDTRVIVILHPDTKEANEKIEDIRARFLEVTGQQSVLRVTQEATVSF